MIWRDDFCDQAVKLCRLGATDKDLADFFGVSVWTINEWKKQHDGFADALREGKMVADLEVANRLYQRALGYSFDEQKLHCDKDGNTLKIEKTTKHLAPDVVACIFWLKNRRPDIWRDRVELGDDQPTDEAEGKTRIDRARRVMYLIKKARDQSGGGAG